MASVVGEICKCVTSDFKCRPTTTPVKVLTIYTNGRFSKLRFFICRGVRQRTGS